jgi:hypothetical protein
MISMMIGPEFISASTHSLTENQVSQRHGKEENGRAKENQI